MAWENPEALAFIRKCLWKQVISCPQALSCWHGKRTYKGSDYYSHEILASTRKLSNIIRRRLKISRKQRQISKKNPNPWWLDFSIYLFPRQRATICWGARLARCWVCWGLTTNCQLAGTGSGLTPGVWTYGAVYVVLASVWPAKSLGRRSLGFYGRTEDWPDDEEIQMRRSWQRDDCRELSDLDSDDSLEGR